MIIVEFMFWVVKVFVFLYVVADLICSVRDVKYQKLWNKEKAMRIRIDPNISRAELCEQYVMFCKRNGCKVEF